MLWFGETRAYRRPSRFIEEVMKSLYSRPFQVVSSWVCAGLLAAGTLAFGQDQSTASTGGWRRVGDSQQSQQPRATDQSAPAYSQQAPNQQAPDQQTYPQQYPANQQYPAQQQYPGPQQYPQAYPTNQQYPAQQQYPANGQYPVSNQSPYNAPPPTPVPALLTMPAGTFVTVRANQLVSTDRNQAGDAFSATLVQPLVVNGVVVAEPGQTIAGRIVESEKGGRIEGEARLKVQLTELTLVDGQQIPIQSQLISRKADTSVGRDAGAIGGTTAIGAIIGAAAGGGSGAAIGGGAGAAASTIGVLLTRGRPSVIYPEQELTFRIEAPVSISTDRAPQAFRYIQPNEYDRPPVMNTRPGPAVYGASAPGFGYPYGGYYGGFYRYPYAYPFWGPSFSLFVGPGFYGRSFYGRGYYGGRGFYRR